MAQLRSMRLAFATVELELVKLLTQVQRAVDCVRQACVAYLRRVEAFFRRDTVRRYRAARPAGQRRPRKQFHFRRVRRR